LTGRIRRIHPDGVDAVLDLVSSGVLRDSLQTAVSSSSLLIDSW
jgi:hypothetical protein